MEKKSNVSLQQAEKIKRNNKHKSRNKLNGKQWKKNQWNQTLFFEKNNKMDKFLARNENKREKTAFVMWSQGSHSCGNLQLSK